MIQAIYFHFAFDVYLAKARINLAAALVYARLDVYS